MHRPALVMAIVIALTRVAAAHQSSVKYAELRVDGDSLAIRFRVSPSDVTEPMGLPPDAAPPAGQAAAHARVGPFVARWLAVSSGGAPCLATTPVTSVDADVRFVAIEWRARCATAINEMGLLLDFTRFFAVDPRHVAIVRLDAPDSEPVDVMVGAGQPVISLHAAAPVSWLASLRLGIEHAASIRRHACFVIALLLVVVLDRGETWRLRTLAAASRRTASVMAGFTLAHLASWLVASLGWIDVDAGVVTILVVVSIVYIAVEDVVVPATRSRMRIIVASGFGLVHGLAFAGPGSLAYVVGVELSQIAIVLIALPAIISLARAMGAMRYRSIALPIAAGAVVLAAIM